MMISIIQFFYSNPVNWDLGCLLSIGSHGYYPSSKRAHISSGCFEDGGDSFDGEAARSNVQDSDPSNNNAVAATHVGKRRRKLTSHVWTQFEILPVDPDNKLYAKCMKCGHKYLCDSNMADVLSLYNREKGKLKELLGSISGRVCLTSDLWTSITTDGYLSLTAHFVDANWKLQKRILNFSFMPPPHSGVALCEKIYKLLTSWGVEKKLFCLTLDNASSNDSFVMLLKGQLNLQNALLMNVQDGLKHIHDSVGKLGKVLSMLEVHKGGNRSS
ncbi:unnamed protein product [Prunus armeniaca]|uniref:BED-type domain-containing protein n=1 Tax=Prunus armeniaca TaxID=36596 RepID=A0A6J5V3E5_PRUAR|nr:unnamed protein product [Prunus armeniaca]